MIEVPPPNTDEGRWLRYGAMTCREYIWFRSKWSFAVGGFALGVAIWELTTPSPVNWIFALIIFVSSVANFLMAFNWRKSWQFWNMSLELYFLQQELQATMSPN